MGVSDFEKSKKTLQPSQSPRLARNLHEVLGPAPATAQHVVLEEFVACDGYAGRLAVSHSGSKAVAEAAGPRSVGLAQRICMEAPASMAGKYSPTVTTFTAADG